MVCDRQIDADDYRQDAAEADSRGKHGDWRSRSWRVARVPL